MICAAIQTPSPHSFSPQASMSASRHITSSAASFEFASAALAAVDGPAPSSPTVAVAAAAAAAAAAVSPLLAITWTKLTTGQAATATARAASDWLPPPSCGMKVYQQC